MRIRGEDQVDFKGLKDLSVCDIECYKYARLVSCDVERTFSQYKSFFRDNRHIYDVQLKDDFRDSLQQCFTFCLRY
jgi:hypothetical protein